MVYNLDTLVFITFELLSNVITLRLLGVKYDIFNFKCFIFVDVLVCNMNLMCIVLFKTHIQ